MAAAYVCIQRRRKIRTAHIWRDYDNPLDYLDDESIVRKDRLTRPIIHNLYAILQNDLQWPTTRSRALPVSLQIMIALRFYASDIFREIVADIKHISRQIVENADWIKQNFKKSILWNCSFSKHRWSNWLHIYSTKITFYKLTYISHSKKLSFHEHLMCMRFELEIS